MLDPRAHVDVITFAAGTGESNPWLRSRILEGLGEFGIVLDEKRNAAAVRTEACISAEDSRIAVWVVPTDEEIVVARHAAALLEKKSRSWSPARPAPPLSPSPRSSRCPR